MKAQIRFDHQLLAVEDEHVVHAMFELTAPPAPGSAERPALNIALVIDRSGSMSGPKLEYAKQSAAYLVQQMSPKDKLALVTYDDDVQLLQSLAPVHRDSILHAIRSIYPGGMTNLSGGWLKGVEELQRLDGDAARKVVLLTDGLANRGIIDRASLVGMAQNALGARVGTTTIGYGDGFDEELLTSVADAGGGKSYYAESPEDSPGIFAEEFEGLATLVAQNMSVEIRPTKDVELVGVLNEYPTTSVDGGLQMNLGDAYGDENRRVVFELHVPSMAKLGPAKVADIVLRYVSVGDEVGMHETTIPVNVNLVSADEANDAVPDKDVVDEVVILKAARAQKEGRARADFGDLDGAALMFDEAIGNLEAAAPDSERAQELHEHIERLRSSQDDARHHRWNATSSKNAHYSSYNAQRARRKRPKNDPS